MGPYRGERDRPAAPPPETGPVAEMVRQFADPHAFVRELVQNAIDAGATCIEVRAELASGDLATFSVSDDGCGMDRATIEGPLLTLFNSSKEGVEGAIGRYGVGFVSVFAIEPELVLVQTWRQGESWIVRMFPDHSYELESASSRDSSGTCVSLHRKLNPNDFASHADRCREALLRWCRHSPCPVYLTTATWDGAADRIRIDRPLALRAAVFVSQTDGDQRFLVGPTGGSDLLSAAAPGDYDGLDGLDFAGFYNRGLTLLESADVPAELRGLRCKILSSRLQHTISRDDVRRDESFDAAVQAVARLAREELPSALSREIEAQSRLVAAGADEARLASLLAAAIRGPTSLGKDDLHLPLVEPIEGSPVLRLGDAWSRMRKRPPALHADSSTPVTRALAERSRPVIRCSSAVLLRVLAGLFPPQALENAAESFLWVSAIEAGDATDSDRTLCEVLLRCLQNAGIQVNRLALATCESELFGPAVPAAGIESGLAALREVPLWWAGQGGVATLWLNTNDSQVQHAREAARVDPRAAGLLLARLLYCEALGAIEPDDADAFLDASLGRLA